MNHQVTPEEIVFRKRAMLSLAVSLLLTGSFAAGAQAPAAKTQDKPFAVEYYYKVKWGYADEFMRLYRKNHLPLLKEQANRGRILEMRTEAPLYHAAEEARWDYRVTIIWKNATVAHDDYDYSADERRIFPDQQTFRREEQRRFELLIAHWDVAVLPVDMGKQ